MKRILVLPEIFFMLLVAVCACKKEYSYERAAGTLMDSLDVCKPVEISGHYRKGAMLSSDSFFVTVEVNITKTGGYNISTDLNNGFRFSGAGTFTSLGLQKVRLQAEGIPLLDTLTQFNSSFDNSVCTFIISVKTDSIIIPNPSLPSDTLELNTWRFTDSTDGTFHRGIIDLQSTWLKVSSNQNYLNIMGWPGTRRGYNTDTLFSIALYLPRPQVDTGTYPITAGIEGENIFIYANNKALPDAGPQSYFFFYHSSAYDNPTFSFRITYYDPVQKLVKGNFEGPSQRRKEYSDYVGGLHHVRGSFYFQLP
jgi:hypothetical protein